MSDPRIPDVSFSRTLARENGSILHGSHTSTRFEAFGAYQFKKKFRTKGRDFSPRLPNRLADRRDYSLKMYRLRINGKWYMPGKKKYVFLSLNEIALTMVAMENTGEFV